VAHGVHVQPHRAQTARRETRARRFGEEVEEFEQVGRAVARRSLLFPPPALNALAARGEQLAAGAYVALGRERRDDTSLAPDAARLALGDDPLAAARAARAAASRAVRDGLRGLGAGAGPVDVIGLAERRAGNPAVP
jgi:hypothetical protein